MRTKLLYALLLCLFLTAFSHAASIGTFGIKLDLNGDHEFSGPGGSADYDIVSGTGISLVLESLVDQHTWAFGVGLEFCLPHEIDYDPGDPKFTFLPVYMIMSTDPDEVVSLAGYLGYNLSFSGNDDYDGGADLSGGLFLGVGIGAYMDRFRIEVRYSMYEGDIDYGGGSVDVTHTELSLLVGLVF